MSRKPSKKPKPRADSITVTKKLAAVSQIYAAIWLWFHYDQPLSILALASNANDCYDAFGGHVGRPSVYKIWLSKQSRTFQDRANYVYEFIRHGRKDLKQSTPYSPKQGEMLIVDSIDCHNHLFGDIPPLMSAFNLRLLLENPDVLLAPDYSVLLTKFRKIKNAARLREPNFSKQSLRSRLSESLKGLLASRRSPDLSRCLTRFDGVHSVAPLEDFTRACNFHTESAATPSDFI